MELKLPVASVTAMILFFFSAVKYKIVCFILLNSIGLAERKKSIMTLSTQGFSVLAYFWQESLELFAVY